MFNRLFSWFENRVDPYPASEPKTPRNGLFGFIWSNLEGVRGWLVLLALLSGGIGIGEALLFQFIGKIVDWLGRYTPETLFAEKGLALVGMGVLMVVLVIWTFFTSSIRLQVLQGVFPMRLRWNFHRLMLGQSLSFYQDEFAGRVSAKVMQTALAVRDTVMTIADMVMYVLVYFITSGVILVALDSWLLLPFVGWLIGFSLVMRFLIPRLGQTAARRAVQRLGAKSLPTGSYPVLFDATVSGSLIGHLAGALSGGALYRQTSFLQDSIGRQILPAALSLREEPHLPKALASTAFDAEGVATRPRFVIENGIIQGYFLSSYSARKLGLPTTANAGGTHNLILSHTHPSQAELLREMGSGLLVTELMGQGVNTLTGDYSRGAAGFWVENGQIAYPVQEITIASRLQDMLPNIAGAANDALKRSAHKTGSLLLEQMTVAGH